MEPEKDSEGETAAATAVGCPSDSVRRSMCEW